MKKILLIEDNAEIRENMAEILDLAGYLVFTAENGKDGVARAIREKPDLILCDIMMPVLDGYGVLHMVQKHNDLQTKPFIFLTARSERSEIRRGMEMGADDYITKPFDGTELLHAIEVRLKKAEQLKQQFPGNAQGVSELMSIASGKDELEALKEGRSINRYKKKQVIYTEGNHPSRLFYVQKGKVKTFKRNDDGKELIVGLFNEGDFIGYLPLLEGSIYRDTAEALEDTELAIIPRTEFEELLGSNPSVMRKFIGILARNVDDREEQLLAIAYNSLRKKVADTLVTLYKKYNAKNDPAFQIDLSRENLAAIAGVAKESLIRMLGELKEENLVSLEGGKIRILDYTRLEQMFN
ncbi:response regulator [Taibaiella chishuiensis]|uniref:CRP-like cAMP-binding protein n=1 Tax=Taibaiella chishuiensis TaxID=1434707 RepID=A0A2P8D1V7_9BACT|nr:response regulator [Taibaiella chishuiensis]PSK91202.1 CRP-like cAMP-binding protein [Taibaiella chishuiensis]